MADEVDGLLERFDGKDRPVRVEIEGYGAYWVPLKQGRARVVEFRGQRCEHVSELADGTWVYRPKDW